MGIGENQLDGSMLAAELKLVFDLKSGRRTAHVEYAWVPAVYATLLPLTDAAGIGVRFKCRSYELGWDSLVASRDAIHRFAREAGKVLTFAAYLKLFAFNANSLDKRNRLSKLK
jgi:hypothetical protein